MLELDRRNIPGAMIATSAFESAVDAQAAVWAFKPAVVYVPHPLQNRSDQEVATLADEAWEAILAAITSPIKT